MAFLNQKQLKWNDYIDQDIQNYETNREYLPEVLTSQLSIIWLMA